MKISNVSKKVLASALSAAMVVAFTPVVALAAAPTGSAMVKGTTVLDGTVASYIDVNSEGELVTYCFTESLNGGSAEAALNAALDTTGHTITLQKDVAGNFAVDDTLTLDLNGHTLTNEGATETTATVTIAADKTLTVKGGTITAVQGEEKSCAAIAGTGSLNVASGTFDGTVNANIVDIKSGTFNGTVTDSTAGFTIKDGTFAVSSDKGDAKAIVATGSGTISVSGSVSVKAETSKNDKSAVAVDGNINTTTDKAALTISAVTTGADGDAAGTPDAIGVSGWLAVNSAKATAEVTATAKDDAAYAKAVADNFLGAATLTATVAGAYDAVNAAQEPLAIAIGAKTKNAAHKITGGKYTGAIVTSTGDDKFVTAGTFTANPKTFVDTDAYTIVDDSEFYTVFAKTVSTPTYTGFGATSWFADSQKAAINDAVADVLADVTDGKAVSNVVYAEGKSAADLKAAIAAGKISFEATAAKYNAKTASDVDKANFAAIEAMVKDKKSAIVEDSTFTFTVALTNGEAGSKKVVYGYLTDLGTADRGAARTVVFNTADDAAAEDYGFTASAVTSNGFGIATAVDGKAADAELTKDRTGALTHEVATTGMFAVYSLSLSEVSKPEEPVVTPEKATQSVDVAQKSRTVKLAKGKTKTQKALYFKMGASAETALTTAKKSGSSRITVSGDKVTLKKGTKKGTYTAKVSLKAASSAEYLAAAKTITVKFVVKK